MILGIDPSFTSTGVCLFDENSGVVKTTKFGKAGSCYTNIVENHQVCEFIINSISEFIADVSDIDVICEYPAFATRSGAYLAILNGQLSAFFKLDSRIKSVTWVPPTACESFTKNKLHSKTHLVEWCKSEGLISKRTSHDECTAIILAKLLVSIRKGTYKNSSFISSK